VLLPPLEMKEFEQEAATIGLHPTERLITRHKAGSRPLRHITTFGLQGQLVREQELIVYEPEEAVYTAEFRALLRDFYLAF
jgi:tRNA1Val (adenine37-N6)-methyltransferase